jgi:flagellar motor switch protein FliG
MDTNIMDTGSRPTGLQKATALLLTLGVELAASVLQYLGEADLEKVMLALSEASRLPAHVRREALQEAYALALAGGTGMVSGGIEYTRQLRARAVGPRRGAEILERISAHKQVSSFEIIRSADQCR